MSVKRSFSSAKYVCIRAEAVRKLGGGGEGREQQSGETKALEMPQGMMMILSIFFSFFFLLSSSAVIILGWHQS